MKTFIRILSWVFTALTIAGLSFRLFPPTDFHESWGIIYSALGGALYVMIEKPIFDKLFKD